MIAELVYMLLSILIRFTPLVGTKPIYGSKMARLVGDKLPCFAFSLPLVGWVVVSVRHLSANAWLPQRVVAAYWLGGAPPEADQGTVGDRSGQKPKGNPVSFSGRLRRLMAKPGLGQTGRFRRRL
jgi:hypothetical protein